MENTIVTKELKTAMKNADSITIKLEGQSAEIICRKKVKIKGFSGDTSHVQNGFKCYLPEGFNKAYFSETLYQSNQGNCAVLAQLIKVGDNLVFHCFDNTNQYLKNAEIPLKNWNDSRYHTDYYGLHNDTLTVSIMRKGKTFISNFTIDNRQTPDNSARPLQR